jgi:hypothetical protein
VVPISKNLLFQAISYLKQRSDPMAKMLEEQFRYAIYQHDQEEQKRNA